MLKMTHSRNWTLAMMMYAADHQDQVPADFEQAKEFLNGKDKGEVVAAADQFEIVYQGRWSGVKDPSKTVVLREKQAHQLPGGKWAKVYGFADGHSEVHKEADGNFDAWEKEHILQPSAPAQ